MRPRACGAEQPVVDVMHGVVGSDEEGGLGREAAKCMGTLNEVATRRSGSDRIGNADRR